MKPGLEICAVSVASVINAEKAGAARVELCAGIYEGGVTPSYGIIASAKKYTSIDINVMIRPRGQDFCYSDIEFEIMKKDIEFCKELRVNGVVFGILNSDGTVDTQRCSELVKIARPLHVTFHRAFDMTPDPYAALEDIISTGADTILTSGQQNTAFRGRHLIAGLVKMAKGRIEIMAGGGINEENILKIKNDTGADFFHMSASKNIDSKMIYRKQGIYMGGMPGIPEYGIRESDTERIKKIKDILSER